MAELDTDGKIEQARWELIDESHWNLYIEIEADPGRPGLEHGVVDVSEYHATFFENDRMELVLFDHELPFIYQRIS